MFLIIKLSPVLGLNIAGIMVMGVGGVTFLMASLAAISQTNAKKVLAYSTIANLGLITACGGAGTAEAMWAGIMLIIFHAITKSLLFLCVGTAEHHIGSRDIEAMDGLFEKMPKLASYMMIGIAGMFLAPMGMLVAKWATLVSFTDTRNIFLILIICFGSAATGFYWTKWMGKLSGIIAVSENLEKTVHGEEHFVHLTLVIMTIVACLGFPFMSRGIVVPYMADVFGAVDRMAITANDMIFLCIMAAVIILLFAFFFGRTSKRIVPIYMGGANEGDNRSFIGSMEQQEVVSLRNWYMENYFGEVKMNVIGVAISAVVITVMIGIVAISLLGGM